MARGTGGRPRWLANGLLLLISAAVGLAVCELALRFHYEAAPFAPEAQRHVTLSEGEEVLRWRFSAGDGRNSLGLRNREILAKPPGTTRILALGDSMIWSGEMNSGALYTVAVENNLKAKLGTGSVEVINAGVPGYTTFQELQFLKLHGLDMEPDLVVLGFVFNDLYTPYLHRIDSTEGWRMGWDPRILLNRFDREAFPGSLVADSYLAHEAAFFWERVVKKLTAWPYLGFERRNDFYLAWKDHGWKTSEGLIREIRDLLASREIPLMVMTFPVSEQLDPAKAGLAPPEHVLKPQSKIKEISGRLGLPFVDFTEPLRKGGGADLFVDYLHLNGDGNEIVARELSKFLLENPDVWRKR